MILIIDFGSQFNQLIAQIDENAFKENTFETTLKTIKTLTSFMSEAVGADVQTIDLDVLSHAFKDRNLEKYSNLMDELKVKNQEEISLEILAAKHPHTDGCAHSAQTHHESACYI